MMTSEHVSLVPLRGGIAALVVTAILIATGVAAFWRSHRHIDQQAKRLSAMDDLVWQAILIHDARAGAAEMAVLSGDKVAIRRYRSLAGESARVAQKLHEMGITPATASVLSTLDELTKIEDEAIAAAERQNRPPNEFLEQHEDASTQHRLALEALPRETAKQRTRLREERVEMSRWLVCIMGLATATLVLSSLLIVRTSRKQLLSKRDAERRYAQASRQNRLILEATADGIVGIDADGEVVFFNPSAVRMVRVDPTSGFSPSVHILKSLAPAHETLMAALTAGDAIEPREFDLLRGDGTTLPVEISAAPLRNEDGQCCGGVFTIRDATQRRELDAMKSQFVATVSHELRTPLTAIRGALTLLSGGHLGTLVEKGQRLLAIAINNTDRLSRLVNDILDLERIQSRSSMTLARCNAGELVVNTVDAMRGLAEGNDIRLLASPMDVDIHADGDRVVQVLTNLIGNAIKFAPGGSAINVGVRRSEREAVFHVRDHGRGIPQEKLEMIFGRFQQVDASDAREKGGTGLGLAICRSIVEEHGGNIGVESVPGEGSTFTFTIPLFAAAAEVAGARAHPLTTMLTS
jgi:PAS domain S-box-containing protein